MFLLPDILEGKYLASSFVRLFSSVSIVQSVSITNIHLIPCNRSTNAGGVGKRKQQLTSYKPAPAAVFGGKRPCCHIVYKRCHSCISYLLTGSITQSRLKGRAFELYSLLLWRHETRDVRAALEGQREERRPFLAAGGGRCLSELPDTLSSFLFQSSSFWKET